MGRWIRMFRLVYVIQVGYIRLGTVLQLHLGISLIVLDILLKVNFVISIY